MVAASRAATGPAAWSGGTFGGGHGLRLPTPGPTRRARRWPGRAEPWVGWRLLGPGAVSAPALDRNGGAPRQWRRRRSTAPTIRPRRARRVGASPWRWSPGCSWSSSCSIVVVLLVVKITRGTTTVVPPPVAPASSGVVHAVTTVPSAVFDAVGAQQAADPGEAVLSGSAPAVDRRAARPWSTWERNSAPTARPSGGPSWPPSGRFGTFSHLGRHVVVDGRGLPGHTDVHLRRHHLPEPLRLVRRRRGIR